MGSRCLAWKHIDPWDSHWYANIATSTGRKSLHKEEIFHSKSFLLQTPSINTACVEPSLPSPPSYGAPIDSRPSKHHLLFGAMHMAINRFVSRDRKDAIRYRQQLVARRLQLLRWQSDLWKFDYWMKLLAGGRLWKVCIKWPPHPQVILFFDGSNNTIRISIFFPMLVFFFF